MDYEMSAPGQKQEKRRAPRTHHFQGLRARYFRSTGEDYLQLWIFFSVPAGHCAGSRADSTVCWCHVTREAGARLSPGGSGVELPFWASPALRLFGALDNLVAICMTEIVRIPFEFAGYTYVSHCYLK